MIDVDQSSMSELSRHDSELSGDSGYASSPHTALPTTNSINSQYLEALYSTKASLAYFAKSALSRARADFQHGENSIQEDSLLTCLQNLILSDDGFNCKYENVSAQPEPGTTIYIVPYHGRGAKASGPEIQTRRWRES